MKAPKRRTIDERWSALDMYPNRAGSVMWEIERAVTELYPTQPFGTHGSVCADLLLWELTRNESARENPQAWRESIIVKLLNDAKPLIGTVLVYSRNDPATGTRVPKPMDQQRQAFRRNLFAAYPQAVAALTKMTETPAERVAETPINQISISDFESPKPVCKTCGDVVQRPEAVWFQDTQQCAKCWKETQQQPVKPKTNSNPALAHRDWSQNVRSICESKAADGQPLWDWGMRNTLDGAAIILSAMRESAETAREVAEAVRDACTMHFPDDVRRECGVTEAFDFVGFGVPRYLKLVADARVPLPRGRSRSVCAMMVGPMGSGKSTNAETLADELGVPYGKVSMTRGTSPTAFNGKQRVTDDGSLLGVLTAIAGGNHEEARELAQTAMDAGDVTVSQWVRIYTGGGVFLFDEIDAADSNLLLIVNDALSSAGFSNAATGQTLARHEAFVGIAAGNTIGLGADRIYGGRERLDGASLDRWAAGRIRVGYDSALEDSIVESMV